MQGIGGRDSQTHAAKLNKLTPKKQRRPAQLIRLLRFDFDFGFGFDFDFGFFLALRRR
ncbi:MAG: hypothetical protein ACI91B_004668, partial [Planctomycetota bacterium]